MFKLDSHPTLEDYNYIHSWMEIAQKKQLTNCGLINNLDEKDFENGKVIVYKQNGKAEIFLNYERFDKQVLQMNVMSLNPDFYHKGIGSKFLTKVLNHFKREGILVYEAYQATHKGLRLINKFNFVKKEFGYTGYNDWRVKFAVEHRKQNWSANRRLVLWNSFDTQKKPIKSWSLSVKKESKPILTYAFFDWEIGIMDHDTIVKHDKVKYFPIICNCMLNRDYIYVTNKDLLSLNKYVLEKQLDSL